MKGIILAGGRATRLGQLTLGISKQLLSVYKTPMIYFPLKTLIDMGIEDILIIVASELQLTLFKLYLEDGSKFGVNIHYEIQGQPNGLAEAFILGEKFIGKDDVTLILGDNILLNGGKLSPTPNSIYTYTVKDPSAYGVAELHDDGTLTSIVEKPKTFISDQAVIGLYVFDNSCVELAKKVKPSARGELEIVDLIKLIHEESGVTVRPFSGVWFDCGTFDDLLECGEFVRALDKRTTSDIFLSRI